MKNEATSLEEITVAEFEARTERTLAAWEIASVVTSTLVAEWVVIALVGDQSPLMLVPIALAFAQIFISQTTRRETLSELGLRFDNFWRALKLLLAPMIVFTSVLLIIGWLSSGVDFLRWRGGQTILGLPALGFLWGFAQQFALQSFINRRAQNVWGRGARSVLLVAAVFALLHFPNPVITLATFVGGLVWAWVYQREPNLWALAVSHSLMTWVLVSTVPAHLLNGLRVGYKFFG